MPDLNLFTNLGIAGVTLSIIYVIIRYFMASLDRKDIALEKKDVELREMILEFRTHIELCNSNFIKFSQHFAKVASKQTLSLDNLIVKIEGIAKK